MGLTTVGLNTIRSLLGSPTPSIPTHVAIGSGTTAFADSDTTLDHEVDRNAINTYDLSIAKVGTYIVDFSSTELSGLTITEFGMYNAASVGSLFNREVIGSIDFAGDRELQLQVSLRISGA